MTAALTEPFHERFAALRALDPSHRLFGATGHGYRSQTVSEQELQSFERKLGVALPHEYRHFLGNVGWGAGPFYGLFSPSEVLTELGIDDPVDPGEPPRPKPSAPFPFSPTDLAAVEARRAAGDRSAMCGAPFPCDGMIVICHEGCTFWSLLVTAGSFAGTVWTVASGTEFEGAYSPGYVTTTLPGIAGAPGRRRERGWPTPPTFRAWYEGWLDEAIAGLTD